MKTPAQKLRKAIDALSKNLAAIIAMGCSTEARESLRFTIDELEDAYIAEINAESEDAK
jgi:predicted DNA-binding protein